jgi:glycosyltransferase involved in cell wall biosynthesis
MERPRAAVIVPCRDGADWLAACLDALRPQLEPARAVALVIDDCSRVPLAEAAPTRGFFAEGGMRVIRRPNAGEPGAARNTGFDMSPVKRAAFAVGILLASPVYAALASWYVLAPWLAARPRDWTLASAVIALSAAKAFAAAWRALVPARAFHPGMSPAERPSLPR